MSLTIDIICPLYNAGKYIENLHNSFEMQENVELKNIRYIVTNTNDNIEKSLKNKKCIYKKIEKENFSHSLTREQEAFKSDADIIVFVTQDVIIKDRMWLYHLVKDIESGKCEATFSKQLCLNNSVEKYTREKNYPENSYIVSKNDIDRLGLRTFFFSDAAGAIKRNVFVELKGYDGKDLPISEDMYFAYKLIMNGYKIKYCAESEVIHSHKFTWKQLYKRYYDTGKFFKQNSYLDKYGTTGTGAGLAKYILKRALQDKNVKVLIDYVPNMSARFIGMKVGKIKG